MYNNLCSSFWIVHQTFNIYNLKVICQNQLDSQLLQNWCTCIHVHKTAGTLSVIPRSRHLGGIDFLYVLDHRQDWDDKHHCLCSLLCAVSSWFLEHELAAKVTTILSQEASCSGCKTVSKKAKKFKFSNSVTNKLQFLILCSCICQH